MTGGGRYRYQERNQINDRSVSVSVNLCLIISSKTKGPGEEGAAGYCLKILLPKRPKWCSVLSIGATGKFALDIGHFLRRNFWMISGGPFLSQPLCFAAEISSEKSSFGR